MEEAIVDIRPYLAAAIARNDKAYAKARQLYCERIADCESTLGSSALAEHVYIVSCPIEVHIKARQALAVLLTYPEETAYNLVRQGWIGLCQRIEKGIRGIEMYILNSSSDAIALDRLAVAILVYMKLERQIPPGIHKAFSDLARVYEEEPEPITDISRGREAFPKNGHTGIRMAVFLFSTDSACTGFGSSVCQVRYSTVVPRSSAIITKYSVGTVRSLLRTSAK